MNERQMESLLYAFDTLQHIKQEIEGTGKHKRIVKKLDNALGEIENACYLARKGDQK